ncbi:molecular chaperone [Deinococcus altitudinis]|uniref:fimbrial biogenesis chaperone n=1 Tax=Deinococcus altitudinis TaxID=468914 RepID=UPI003891AD9A
MTILKRLPRPFLLLCLFWVTGTLGAGLASRVSVSPVTLQLQPNVRATQLTLTNQGTTPVTFDLSLMAWSQSGGQDVLSSTQAVVVAPATVTLAPGKAQTVRLARLGNPTLTEQAYRLIATERPSDGAGVTTRLQLVLPLFDGPVSTAPTDDVTASAELNVQASLSPDGHVTLTNPGTTHLQLNTLELQVGGKWQPAPLLYLLAGQSRRLDTVGVQAARYTTGGTARSVALR